MTLKVASHIPQQGQGGTGGSQEKDRKASMAAAPQSSSRRQASGRVPSQTSQMQEVGEQRVYVCMCCVFWCVAGATVQSSASLSHKPQFSEDSATLLYSWHACPVLSLPPTSCICAYLLLHWTRNATTSCSPPSDNVCFHSSLSLTLYCGVLSFLPPSLLKHNVFITPCLHRSGMFSFFLPSSLLKCYVCAHSHYPGAWVLPYS